MSIVGQIAVESRRYSGWIDPRYPIGYWHGALAVTGNASGGVLGIDLLFQQANGASRLNSQLYSVERFGVSGAEQADRRAAVTATNMGGPSNRGFEQKYTIQLFSDGAKTNVEGNQLTMLPWFLGSQRTPGVTAAFSLIVANTDTIEYVFEAEGYRWSPRSVLVDGGPQRPPTGLYAR